MIIEHPSILKEINQISGACVWLVHGTNVNSSDMIMTSWMLLIVFSWLFISFLELFSIAKIQIILECFLSGARNKILDQQKRCCCKVSGLLCVMLGNGKEALPGLLQSTELSQTAAFVSSQY